VAEAPTETFEEIASEPPFGAAVIVYRSVAGAIEYLLLHRSAYPPDFDGDWAWTPPAGGRLPGEDVAACAARELFEETRLSAPLRATELGNDVCPVFVAEVAPTTEVVIDAEHDSFRWVTLSEVLRLSRPEGVAIPFEALAKELDA
jgi:ADP-ribose pyrophosphatase YjhB (NUDIX family)